jgi:hypothetical protein
MGVTDETFHRLRTRLLDAPHRWLRRCSPHKGARM